jgi:gliding motility-associated-like protein
MFARLKHTTLKRLFYLTIIPLFFSVNAICQQQAMPVKGNALEFIPNKGQVADMAGKQHSEILFHCMSRNKQFFLKENGISYVILQPHDNDSKDDDMQPGVAAQDTLKMCRVDMDFIGALKPLAETSNPTEGYQNFFLPQCPNGISNLKAYNTITCKGMYQNIDVVYEGSISAGLKYDIVVSAGGNPADIKMQYTGATSVEITSDGKLDISTPVGKMKQYIPHIYQDIDGSRKEVEGHYQMLKHADGQTTIGFKIGDYNKSYALTIDPYWSTYICGSWEDGALGCVFDNANNLLVTGYTGDINFPSTPGAFQVANAGGAYNMEAFVIKFSPTGTRLWATYYGGTGGDEGYGIVVDASNNVIFTGTTASTNFPVSAGAFQTTYYGTSGCLFCSASNAFLVKLDPTGATRLWGTYYGGNDFTYATGIAIDPSGNIAIGGPTSSKTLPVSAGCFQSAAGSTNAGYEDGFVTEFNSSGGNLWGTYVGGSLSDWGNAVAVDNSGNVYFTGSTQSTDYPVSAGAYQTTFGGGIGWGDAFVIKFNNAGTMQWSTYLGGSKDDGGHAIGVDDNSNIIVTGLVQSTNFPVTAGAYQTTNLNIINHKVNDDFLTKFSPTGNVIWSTYSNVFSENGAQSMTIDQYNNIYVTDDIEFSGPDTPKVLVPPITTCAFDKAFNTNNFTVADVAGGEDNYITKYNTNGFPVCATYLGGSGADEHESYTKNIAVQNCRMAVAGETSGYFIIPPGAFQIKFGDTIPNGSFGGYVTDMNVFACGDTDLILTFSDSVKNLTCSSVASFHTHICDSTDTTGVTFSWTFTGGNPSSGTGINIYGISYAAAGTYPVTLNLVDCGSILATATNSITVPTGASVNVTPAKDSLCSGGNINLTASGATGYTWKPAGSLSASTGATVNASPTVTTTYTIVGSTGSCSDSVTAIIKITPAPVPVVSNTQNICPGNLVTLNASGGTTYIWSTGATSSAITINPSVSGTYSVIISNGPCGSKDSVQVNVDPLPTGNACCSTTITIGSDTVLSVIPVVKGSTYDWTPGAGLSCTTCPNPIASPSVTTTYYVTITDSNGCIKKDTVTITVNEDCGTVFVPNAFSPNGDMENDILYVYGPCIKTLEFSIYDRWGNEVFETKDVKGGWDGKYNGVLMNTGVFVYTLKAVLLDNSTVSKKGNVTLLR